MWRWRYAPVYAAIFAVGIWLGGLWRRAEAPILVGLLHSRTGPLAANEKAMLDAEVMAIEEINEAGGLMGRRVVPVIADGESDPRVFAREARRLIEVEKVGAIFGGMTSACRRAIDDIVTPADHLFIFPSNYEGMDFSPNIICTGPLPNQQAIPAVAWCFDALKARKFFLAGSNDVLSYAVNTIVKDQLKAIGGECVGEAFTTIEGQGVTELVAAIGKSGADVVFSSVIGDANKGFYQELAAAGLTAEKLPVVSVTVGEEDLRELPADAIAGHYAAWGYFQSLDEPENRDFVARFKKRWGANRSTNDPAVSAYNGVKLWAQAVAEAQTDATSEVRKHLRRQSRRSSAAGLASIDYATLHSWRPLYLGKARRDGQFDIVWGLERPIRPVPYPMFRTWSYWDAAVEKWFHSGYSAVGETPAPAAPSSEPKPGPEPTPPAAESTAAEASS